MVSKKYSPEAYKYKDPEELKAKQDAKNYANLLF
jgi:hypothetical protein